jgi:TPR repeat protein
MLKKQFFYFCFLIGIIFLQNSTLQPKNLGKPYFEKAYSIEKEDPDKAIELYNKALKEGLDADLRKTALWRLYFIYKDKKKYILAWSILKQIPNKSSVENKFYEDVQYYTNFRKKIF